MTAHRMDITSSNFLVFFKFHPKQSKIFILYSKIVIYWSSANFSC
jgi:hypothetical protein